jgi:predicted regulator of Ras-like GTPase activity (Roadblock/LC7/MglB family)
MPSTKVCTMGWHPLCFSHFATFFKYPGSMFRFFKNLFSKKQANSPAIVPAAMSAAPVSMVSGLHQVAAPVPVRVETAQLSLASIMAKFPDDLRKLVLKLPPPDAMVVLPIPMIQKYLPTGSVKMSLASVVRQAPAGTFATINPQDKRLVEVPLAEIFKRISPALLRKRDDQKLTDLAQDGFDIFGDEENPYAVAPRVDASVVTPSLPTPIPASVPASRVLQTTPGVVTAAPAATPAPLGRGPLPTNTQTPRNLPPDSIPSPFARQMPTAVPAQSPPPSPPAASPASTPPPTSDQPPLVLPLRDLLGGWPEPIKSEAAALNGADVALPADDISAGLAKGKVAFQWGQIRTWIIPPPSGASKGSDATELLLPLRIIAPAFLKHTKLGGAQKKISVGADIPELFTGGRAAAPEAKAPEPPAPAAVRAPAPVTAPKPVEQPKPAPKSRKQEPAPKPAVAPTPAPKPAAPEPTVAEVLPAAIEPAPEAEVEKAPAVAESAPVVIPEPVEAPPPAPEPEPEVAPAIADEPGAPAAEAAAVAPGEAPAPETLPVPEPVVEKPAAALAEAAAPTPVTPPVPATLPKTLGELFGQPEKTTWSPTEVANHLMELPGVAGAVVALQEGLVIAHRLPEPLKGEVFAAFLPQIFARITQYSGEMKLGGVEDIIVNTAGGQCHMFRVGQVFFAALSKPGHTLPAHHLRLCAEAVAG